MSTTLFSLAAALQAGPVLAETPLPNETQTFIENTALTNEAHDHSLANTIVHTAANAAGSFLDFAIPDAHAQNLEPLTPPHLSLDGYIGPKEIGLLTLGVIGSIGFGLYLRNTTRKTNPAPSPLAAKSPPPPLGLSEFMNIVDSDNSGYKDFRNRNLSQINFNELWFKRLVDWKNLKFNFQGAQLPDDMQKWPITLHGIKLDLSQIEFLQSHAVSLEGADLTDTDLSGFQPEKNKPSGGAPSNDGFIVDFRSVTLPKNPKHWPNSFAKIWLDGKQAIQILNAGGSLKGASLRGASFAPGMLEGLNNPDFSGMDLRGSSFGAYGLLAGAKFKGANLRDAEIMGMDLRGADFSGADLTGADLRRTNLTGANVENTNFKDANLEHDTLPQN